MRSPIATLGVATALALCCPQPDARAAGIDDICLIVAVSGMVTATVGRCEPTELETREFRHGAGAEGVLWVEIYIRMP